MLTEVGPKLTSIDHLWPGIGHIRAEFDRNQADVDQFGPESAKDEPKLSEFGQTVSA